VPNWQIQHTLYKVEIGKNATFWDVFIKWDVKFKEALDVDPYSIACKKDIEDFRENFTSGHYNIILEIDSELSNSELFEIIKQEWKNY
jgi:hypothetical protein